MVAVKNVRGTEHLTGQDRPGCPLNGSRGPAGYVDVNARESAFTKLDVQAPKSTGKLQDNHQGIVTSLILHAVLSTLLTTRVSHCTGVECNSKGEWTR